MEKNSKKSFILNRKKGFTLVELIVVLVIVTILAAVSVPLLIGYIDSAREKKSVNRAEIARKATQAALTSLYNDGGYRFTNEMRDAVEVEVGDEVSKTGTSFMVWTYKALGDSSNSATIGNIGAYTINRAYYQENDTVYVLYKDGAWEYNEYDNKDAADTAINTFKNEAAEAVEYSSIASGYTVADFGMLVWGGIRNDYANRSDTIEQDTYAWDINGLGDIQKRLTLKGFLERDAEGNAHGLYFKNSAGTCEESVNLIVKKGHVENTWIQKNSRIQVLDENGVSWELQIEKEGISFKDQKGWKYSDTEGSYSNAVAYLNDQEDEVFPTEETIELVYELPYDTKWARFSAYNPNTLSIPSAGAEDYIDLCFRKYQASWRSTYEVNDQGIEDGACDWAKLSAVDVPASLKEETGKTKPTAELIGWANKVGDEYIYRDAEGDAFVTPEQVWDYVWSNRGGSENSPFIFHGVIKINALITLKANDLSTFRNGDLATYYSVSFNELSGKVVSEPDFSRYSNNPIVPTKEKAVFYGWNEEVNGVVDRIEIYKDENALKEYFTKHKGLSELTYVFVARVLDVGLAKFNGAGNSTDLKGMRGQLYYMGKADVNNGDKKKLKSFERVSSEGAFLNAVSGYFDGSLLNDSGQFNKNFKVKVNGESRNAEKTSGSARFFKIETSAIDRFFVLYDGSEKGYSEPIFGYTVPLSDGYYAGYWYTRDQNPKLVGDFTACFNGFDNLRLNSNTEIQSWDTSLCTDMKQMFKGCKFDTVNMPMLDLWDWKTTSVKNVSEMFSGSNLVNVKMRLDATHIYFPRATHGSNWNYGFRQMFYKCTNLTTVYIRIENTDTTTGVSFTEMFTGCSKLTNVDLGPEPKLTFTARGMFQSCTSLVSINITFDFTVYENNTDSVGNAREIFDGCTSLKEATVHLISSDKCPICVRKIFNGCTSLEKVDLGKDTLYFLHGDWSGNDSTWKMFYNCKALKSIEMSIDTTCSHNKNNQKDRITLESTFEGCEQLERVTIKGNFTDVTTMKNMFKGDRNLTFLSIQGMDEDAVVSFDNLNNTDSLSGFLNLNNSNLKQDMIPSFLNSFGHWRFRADYKISDASATFMNAMSKTTFLEYIQSNNLEFKDADGKVYTINGSNKLEKTN